MHELQEDVLLELETGLMEGVREDTEHVLQEGKIVLFEEGNVHLWRPREQALQELRQDLETTVRNLRLLMLHGPYQRIHVQFQLTFRQEEERLEAVRVDRLQQVIELGPVIRVALEVAFDHVASALKNHMEDLCDLLGNRLAEPCSQCGEEVQDLRVAGLWQVAAVVFKNWLQQWWNETLRQLLHGQTNLRSTLLRCGHVHKRLDQPQRIALHVPHEAHVSVADHLRALLRSAVGNEVAANLVDLEHIEVDACKLAVTCSSDGTHHALIYPQDQ
mmetsp:Transcript_84517/g.196514  ORF Transcript_84517/g.196514 Transcript_84517/m.196514 type:complete len:274 (-) Transcript_84517:2386-3207(-)